MSQNVADYEIIRCLLTTRTVKAAAACAGCDRRTIQRRMEDPTFRSALATAERELLAKLTDELERLALASTRRLWAFLENDTAEDKTVLRACGLVLANAIRYRETADLQKRLEALENALKNSK